MKGKYQCVRKRWYPDKIKAMLEIQRVNEKYGAHITRCYKCNWCLGYHLTSK